VHAKPVHLYRSKLGLATGIAFINMENMLALPIIQRAKIFVEIKSAIRVVWHLKELDRFMMTSQGLRKPRL
jgi:hypothetical protein